MFPVIVLAGGLAMRLRPATDKIPKSMLKVNGKPFIYHQLVLLQNKGINDVVLCLGHLGEQIENYIKNTKHFRLNITYSYDGEVQLGTGGALKKAAANLNTSFFVLYGDSYLDIDYKAVQGAYAETSKPALMTVFKNAGLFDKSNVLYTDGMIIKYDKHNPLQKMEHIDYGLGIMEKKVLLDFSYNDAFDLANVYVKLCETGNLAGYEVNKRFYEIGSFKGLSDLEQYLRGVEIS